MRILIADDEVELGRVFKLLLLYAFPTSSIDVVANGLEAVNAFRNEPYDISIMDVRMPEKDGYSACIEIQDICRQQNLKMPFVIFYTGGELSQEMNALLADKANCTILKKPVTCDQIIAKIKAIHECRHPEEN